MGKEAILDPMVLQTIEIQLGQATHLCHSLLQTPTKGMETLSPLPPQPGMNSKPALLNFDFPGVKMPNSNQATYFAFFFSWITEELSNITKLKTVSC